MNPKNYYQEKGNGAGHVGGNGKSSSAEDLRKRLAELEKHHKRNAHALEHAVDAIVNINSDKNITFFNKAAESVFGYGRQEVLGQNVKIIIPIEQLELHDKYVSDGGDNTPSVKGKDLELIGKDGSKFWGNLSISHYEIDNEISYTVFIKDISSQRSSMEMMQQIHRELETRMAQIDVACLVSESDLKGNIILVNDKFCEVTKFTSQELIGQPQSIVRHPDSPKELFRELWATIGKGKIFKGVIKNRTKDGSAYWVDATIAPVIGTNGQPVKYISVQFDITGQVAKEQEIKNAMEESLAQEEELRQTMEEIQATQEEMARKQLEMEGQMNAINSTSAFIEFKPDGTILKANDLFLKSTKYLLSEIEGKHHRIFCTPEYVITKEYEMFWSFLRAGKSQIGEFKRIAKDGSEVWLLASYTPVFNNGGEVVKIIKLATDITESKLRNANFKGQIEAISKSQAIIEFNMDGTVITANDNFLNVMGYTLNEIAGVHHQLFVDDTVARSKEYKSFWSKLNNGEYIAEEFKRYGKGGKEIWIQASYNPIFDLNGKPFKVVKFATDVTAQKIQAADNKSQMEAVTRSNAVIEFCLDGTVTYANENFLKVLGYTLEEIKGKHHSIFADASYTNSNDYKEFWRKLNRGEFIAGNFTRKAKDGQDIYIQASYNPILDINGMPVKVVAYATDNTTFTRALKAVSRFTSELREGNLQAELDVKAEGDLARMVDDNIALRDTLKNILLDVNKVVRAAGEDGNLQARLKIANAQGAWRQLVDSVNQLLQSIAEPVMEFNKIITDMSKGDLTQRFQMSASGDIKSMAESLNRAIDNLNDLLFNIGKNADIVASSSMNMLQKTESMKRNTNEVASAISQMAKGAQDQASRTDESSKLVEKVMGSSNEMEKKANIINKAAEKGQKSSDSGLKIMKTLVSNMTGIKDAAGQTSKSIDILTNRAEEIGRTLNVITDIASQTNLLALNAAIEAARAGDAGRGFAVVAEEIRKLAEDSRRSAVEIEKIISDVQKDTQSATKAIDAMQVSVKDGSIATNEAENIFQEIAKSSDETFSFSKEIQDATNGQKTSIDSVVRNIEQIVVVAEETAAGTQEVASSSQQLNNAMGEIAEGSNKLSGIAAELQNGVNKFKLRKAS